MSRKPILAVAGLVALSCEFALAKSVTCTMVSLERTVELRYENPGNAVPCEVRYAKPTEGVGGKVLWRAEHEAGYCEARFDGFVDKLRGFGWSCPESAGDVADESNADAATEPVPKAPAEEPKATDAEAEEASTTAEDDASEVPNTE